MGWCGGRLILVFLIISSSALLPHATASASFYACFPDSSLLRFWADPQYVSSNPNIISAASLQFYSFSFDNSTRSLGLEEISIQSPDAFLAGVPQERRAALSKTASFLSQAQSELSAAKSAQLASHSLSVKAEEAVRENFGVSPLPLDSIHFLSPVACLNRAVKVSDAANYIVFYPHEYSSALEHAASAYGLSQSAASSLAQLVQGEYGYLGKAGAGTGYSGAAASPFNYAESLLAPSSGFCQAEAHAHSIAAEYFSSMPKLPDFSNAGFPQRLNSLAGTGANASISRMLSLYLLLFEAKENMLSEYSTSKLAAQESLQSLSLELSLLGGERLDLIGDSAWAGEGQGSLLAGSSYSGIHGGYLQAKEDFARAKSLLSSSESEFSSKGADGWLSGAISRALSSSEASQNAIASLRMVRGAAEAAVARQKSLASESIAQARQAAGAQAPAFPSASALSASRASLADAEAEFAKAQYSKTMGERFSLYSSAARLAGSAVSLSKGAQGASAMQAAQGSLSSYSSLLSSAQSDGLEVSYEKEKLGDYRELLQGSPSPDIISAVSGALLQDRHALLLRLYESWSYLEGKFARAGFLADAPLAGSPPFTQQVSRLSRHFPDGILDAGGAAGSMRQIERDLDSIISSEEAQVPQYLSAALSQNAQAEEICETPILGQQTDYRALITTQNPSGLSIGSEAIFTVQTSVPLYSADFLSGDFASDAYPSKGGSSIAVPSISPFQRFSFSFSKKDQPAQITSSEEKCLFATQDSARATREISFASSRSLPELSISQSAPNLAHSAYASYGGQDFPLQAGFSGGEGRLEGMIRGVQQGKNSVSISYSVSRPFDISVSQRSHESLPLGSSRVSFTVSTSPPGMGCPEAEISFYEPYSQVSNLSAYPLSGNAVLRARAASIGNETGITLAFARLSKGAPARFSVSYVIQDPSLALSEALSGAQAIVSAYNRSKDALAFAEAGSLISQGRQGEALSVLSQIRQDAQSLLASSGTRLLFLQEKSAANATLESLLASQGMLEGANSSCLPQFSALLFKYHSSLASASSEADSGGYQKAVELLRKANSDLSSSLSSLSLSSLQKSSDEYAKARKAGNGAQLERAKDALSEAQSFYTQGDFTRSLQYSSTALSALSSAGQAAEDAGKQAASEAESIRESYVSLRSQSEAAIASYASQYSALSAQSRRQLPITPAQAQSRLEEADKMLSSSKKASLQPSEALAQANQSYSKLSSLQASLSGALSSLASSASASLGVARAALAEAKSRASAEDAEQIAGEVARSEEFLSNSMYADSIASSDRAIKAANAALSKPGGSGMLQAAALAAISLAFIAGASYYFFFGKGGAKPEGKKETPKAE